jgi:hypothetical protein
VHAALLSGETIELPTAGLSIMEAVGRSVVPAKGGLFLAEGATQ